MNQPEYHETIGVAPGGKVVGVLHIGYPSAIPEAKPRIPATERIVVMDH